ncbi:MAG TPA: hypothetical protein VH722_17210 [Alphaproteobacteria bacterium]|jgi:hypothetical protein|nr:hypothetical protein [Alphaproteobacteria bacterium]
MFAGWQTFYQMTGEAAATLTGLLFIVASLTSGGQNRKHERGVMLFTTPTVFHLASVLAISALALAPDGERSRIVLMIGWAGLSVAYTLFLAVHLARIEDPTHWSDFWWYGAAPVAVYLALAGAGAITWAHIPHAADLLALCLIALLLVTIRNAWDLITWLALRRDP